MDAIPLFPSIIFLLSVTFIPQSTPQHLLNSTAHDGFAVHLVHLDSPLSPFYNNNITTLDRARLAAQRSISRVSYLNSRTSPSLVRDISTRLIPQNPDPAGYIMIFSVGTPPTQVYAIADTGSDVIWLKCPCRYCSTDAPPIFYPSKSSTCKQHSCDSLACNNLGKERIVCSLDFHDPCYYTLGYGDGSWTEGTLSYDKFAFEDPYRNAVEVGYLDFGCSDELGGNLRIGIVGLNRQNLSLISQLGLKKFSYCMVIPDNERSGSRMYFGSQAVISGGQTPLVKGKDEYYYVTLEGISVGDESVPISDGTFDIRDGKGGFIIDSGSTYTILRSEALDALLRTLRKAIHLPERRSPIEQFELCFGGSFDDLALEPDVTFHFYGADVILMKQTTYSELEKGLWCLAILRGKDGISTLGNIQQQNYYVGYDLEAQVVSFAPVDCATF